MATERDIRVIRTADGRGTVKVLVLQRSAGGKLLTCVRVDGVGSGAAFVADARQLVEGE